MRHVFAFKKQLWIITILGIISALSNGSVPYITGRFLDSLITVSQHKTTFFTSSIPMWAFLLGVWAVVQLLANNMDWFVDRLKKKISSGLQLKIQAESFIHILKLPLNFHKNSHMDAQMQKFSTASWRISEIVGTMVDFAPQFLGVLIGITLAATINIILAGILFLGVVVYVILLVVFLRPIAALDSETHRKWNEYWGDAYSAAMQIDSVKQAVAEEHETKKIEATFLDELTKKWYRMQKYWSDIGFFQRIIVFLTQLAVFITSVHFVSTGVITVGDLIALNGYALMFFGPFVSLGYSWQTIQNGITSAALAEEVFNEKEEAYKPEGAVHVEKFLGHVEFKDVSFRYAPDQPEVLNKINLDVRPGSSIALVGESGVGKSTSISLVSGYYFPTEGSVTVDGHDTRTLNLTDLRRHIAVVPQEIALFNDSIFENIRYGSFEASKEEVMRVAKEAHIAEFIETLPEKYETLVGERGVKLSVGQKQRVAIARAMLRNPAILVLDEPTSALDAKTEQNVSESFERLMRGRTTFIIAHRLSTVRKADTILVFEKGKIVEQGSHTELVKKEGGVYRHLYEYQVGLH